MKARLLLFLIFSCLLLSGCPSFSVHPLYKDTDAVAEPALEGTWSPGPNDKEELSFHKSGDHEYSLVIFYPDTQVRQTYEVHLVRLEGQLFMDVIFEDQTVNGAEAEVPFGIVPAHVIVKVKISGAELAYATLEDDAIRKEAASGGTRLDYLQMPEEPLLVTAQTDALRDYISAHPDNAFSDFEVLKRKYGTLTRP